MKIMIIKLVIKAVLWLLPIVVGVWYLYSSVGDASVPYASLPRFLQAIGACDANGVCDIASANGCFLCPYIQKLFFLIGKATETLWDVIIGHTWIVLVIGLVVFMFWQAYEVIKKSNEENAALDAGDRKLDFSKWFEAVRKQFVRVLIAGALIGAAGFGGSKVLRQTANVIIYPVMSIGTSISLAATGMGTESLCGAEDGAAEGAAGPMSFVSDSFMCVIGNLNAAVLYGASSGFAMMGFAWQGLGGGFLSWLGGLVVVLIFLYAGADILFKVLNVVFSLVFLIIFLPLLLAAHAFENLNIAKGVSKGAIDILAKTTVRVIGITIEVMILSGMISYAQKETLSSDPAAEYAIIEKCERVAALPGGGIDKISYRSCFVSERAANPTAFRYLYHGWDFLRMMLFMFLVYHVLMKERLGKIINTSDDAYFKFGDNLKSFGQTVWKFPSQLLKKIPVGKK